MEIPYKRSPLPQVLFEESSATNHFESQINVGLDTLNACTNESTTLDISIDISGQNATSTEDSLQIILPAGITYVPNSFAPGSTAPDGTPAISTNNGLQYLRWGAGVHAPGSTIRFGIDVQAENIGQSCRDYDLIIQTFAAQVGQCVSNGVSCNFISISDELRLPIYIEKPELLIVELQATASPLPPQEEIITLAGSIQNIGSIALPEDDLVQVDLYNDADGNGRLSELDLWLGQISVSGGIDAGASISFSESINLPAGSSCSLIAVLDPSQNCICQVVQSNTVESIFVNAIASNYTICSGESTQIGPEALDNFSYEWFARAGSELSLFQSSPTTTPATIEFNNRTGEPIVWEYGLRTNRGDCYHIDTIRVTILPENQDSISTETCGPIAGCGDAGLAFALSGPTTGSNYQWSIVSGDLTAVIDNPSDPLTQVSSGINQPTVFELQYTDANGCPTTFKQEVRVIDCLCTALGNYTWLDQNVNGIQDENEPPLPGVKVYLYKSNNLEEPIQETITDEAGFYIFQPLPAGEYSVRFDASMATPTVETGPFNDLTITSPNANDNTEDELDSDADQATGFSGSYFVPNGIRNLSLDAGFYPGFDLALTKTVDPGTPGPHYPGSVVDFLIRVQNQGGIPASKVIVTDYIPGDMTYAGGSEGSVTSTLGNNINLTNNGDGTFELDSLAVGDEVQLRIVLRIADNFTGTTIINHAEISLAENLGGIPDVDSQPDTDNTNDPEEEDDHDSAPIEVQECIPPTVSQIEALAGTCIGEVAADDATITLLGIQEVDRYGLSGPDATNYNGPQFFGSAIVAGDQISINNLIHNTIYIIRLYNDANSCFEDITVQTPDLDCEIVCNQAVFDEVPDQRLCEGGTFILPPLTGINLSGNQAYYDLPNGNGNQLAVGTTITSSQVIYYFDAVPDQPDCFAAGSFQVVIQPLPQIDLQPDRTICAGLGFTLPPITGTYLTPNAAYYTEPNGGGQRFSPGDQVSAVGIYYIYDFIAGIENCSSESSFRLMEGVDYYADASCTASFEVPVPAFSTDCEAGIASIQTSIVDQQTGQILSTTLSEDTSNIIENIPVGVYYFVYSITDECEEEMTIECPFQVLDSTPPQALCKPDFDITLSYNQEEAFVHLDHINAGSLDDCSDTRIEIRRYVDSTFCESSPYWTRWNDKVLLNCCDAGQTVTVELRVWDDANQDGQIGEAEDNSAVCQTRVTLIDVFPPTCEAPIAQTVNCNQLPSGFSLDNTSLLDDYLGAAYAIDNCYAYIDELEPIDYTDACGYGTFIRRFQAVDAAGNRSELICTQEVTVYEYHHYNIVFPADVSVLECVQPEVPGVQLVEEGCDLLTVSHQDEIFTASEDACYKIFRTYRVINWCEYDGESEATIIPRAVSNVGEIPVDLHRLANDTVSINFQNLGLPNVGFWEYTQHIKVYDVEKPVVSFDPIEPFCSNDNENCDGQIQFYFLIEEECTPGDLEIQVWLDADSDGTIDGDVSNLVRGFYPGYSFEGSFPIGNHRLLFGVTDGCGNIAETTQTFEVIDCKAPAPICIDGLAIELMPLEPGTDVDQDGDEDAAARTVWASDLLASPIFDCSEPITYSIYKQEDFILNPNLEPSSEQHALTLTCSDIGQVPVRIYAFDQAGNFDFCLVNLSVQNNQAIPCEGSEPAIIAGSIRTESGTPVSEVRMQVNGSQLNEVFTNEDGYFELNGLQVGNDYTVSGLRNYDFLNGVTTFDLVLITKHILGSQLLDSPYKIIAADVNRSNTVSTLDIIQIRKAILNIITEFPNNTSWRFIEASYVFPNPQDPWTHIFPEVVNANDIDDYWDDANFIAVKVGDVNGSASTGAFMELEERNGLEKLQVIVPNWKFQAGETITVDLFLPDINDIQGFQGTLEYDGNILNLKDIQYQLLQEDHLGVFQKENAITFSWNGEWKQEDKLLSIEFETKQGGDLNGLIQFGDQLTRTEAYNKTNDLMEMELVFSVVEQVQDDYLLFQNIPNPFDSETIIQFYFPESNEANLIIQDAAGRIIYQQSDSFDKGYHQLTINKSDLPNTGLFYFTLQTANFTATKKMILID